MGDPRRTRPGFEDGAVVVEFAAVFLLFVTLLWGMITYGVIFAAQQTITHAASEAARATVGQPTQDAARNAALGVATEQLDWLGAPGAPELGDVTFGACPAPAAAQSCAFVEYSYPWATDPIITPLLDIGIPAQLTGSAVVTWDGP